MNGYSLGSDSPKWWWSSAAAGAVATAALGAILVLPTTGNAVPVEESPDPSTGLVGPSGRHLGGRQCFMFQANWNEVLNGPQPVCYDEADWTPASPGPRVIRPDLPVAY